MFDGSRQWRIINKSVAFIGTTKEADKEKEEQVEEMEEVEEVEEVEDIQCWLFKNKVITSKVCYRHLKGLLLNGKCNYNLTLYFLTR